MTQLYLLSEVFTSGFFYSWLDIFSFSSILCGISVIISKNPIVSVLFLIGLFFTIAAYLMLLGLNFIGLSYLLVYVGAVSILFLFILMLINVRISELVTDSQNSIILSIIISILLFISIHDKGNLVNEGISSEFVSANSKQSEASFAVKELSYDNYIEYFGSFNVMDYINNIYHYLNPLREKENLLYATSKLWDGALAEVSHITSIGNVLYTSSPLLLIITSIILLLAMVGAIVITLDKKAN